MTADLRGWSVAAVTVVAVIWAAAALADTGTEAGLLLVQSETTTTVVDARSGEITAAVAGGVPSPSGDVLVSARRRSADTVVSGTAPSTGTLLWSRTVSGRHDVRLVGSDSATVVLTPASDSRDPYQPQPRERTSLTVSGEHGAHRDYLLDGNYEPEALSLDGTQLFVISYVPPAAPKQYQVRRLDLVTGTVHPVFSVDAELQQEMGGTARTQLHTSNRLYTLYTVDDGDQTSTFIHVLALDALWAHCVDLPRGLGASEAATALAASPDGSELFVTDLEAGKVAEVDTAALAVRRVHPIATTQPADSVSAAVTDDRNLVVASGRHVSAFSGPAFVPAGTWRAPERVVGLQPDGPRVLAALEAGTVAVLDPGSSSPIAVITVPGIGTIEGVGGSSHPVQTEDEAFECAC